MKCLSETSNKRLLGKGKYVHTTRTQPDGTFRVTSMTILLVKHLKTCYGKWPSVPSGA